MDASPGEEPVVEPVSLYIDLMKDAKADLEVVARAALAFASGIREVAYIIDPSMELRIELVSGTESSLSLNSLLRSKIVDIIGRISVAALAWGTGTWILKQGAEYGLQHGIDYILSRGETADVPSDKIEAIVKRTLDAFQKQAREQNQRIFRELDTDPAIAGVGISRHPGERPMILVPKSEFHARSVEGFEMDIDAPLRPERRSRNSIETLTLVSPVLLESKRKWKFIGKEGEFGAAIKDGLFLDNVLRGRSTIPMAAGVQLEVELQTIEDPFQGTWIPQQRNILRVRKVIRPVV